jgi:hypothetical protein
MDIEVIVCSPSLENSRWHRRNVEASIGGSVSYRYLRMANEQNQWNGICAAYNAGVQKASADILVFVHEDAFFNTLGWGEILRKKFLEKPDLQVLGVAGTAYLRADNPFWVMPGPPYLHGAVIHELDKGEQFLHTEYGKAGADASVVVADGVFLAIRRSVFAHIHFDEQAFPNYHLYDLDICMQARKWGEVQVTRDIEIKHQSGGGFNDAWKHSAAAFLHKYKDELPALAPGAPPWNESLQTQEKRQLFTNTDLPRRQQISIY